MQHRPSILLVGVLSALAPWLMRCDFSERERAALQIVAPDHGATFRSTNDADVTLEGTQIAVQVAGEGEGTVVELARLRGGTPEVIATSTLQSGLAQFKSVTLYPGSNVLVAREVLTGRTSLPLTVYLEAPCGQVRFIEPAVPENATELTLGPLDDHDDKPCGDGFMLRVVAATGLPDGTEVTLVLDGDTPSSSGKTRGGVLVLDRVPLDQYMNDLDGFPLDLRVGDGTCPLVPFGPPLRIDCEGPAACELEDFNPGGGTLTALQDQDEMRPGVQRDIDVRIEQEAVGQPVELVVNDDGMPSPMGVIDTDGGMPVVHFDKVSLPEGEVRVRAECRDAVGNVTESLSRSVRVDSLGCEITLVTPASDAMFYQDMGQTFASVPVSATFSGGDCREAYVSVEDSEACTNLFDHSIGTISVGQTLLSHTVVLSEEGTHTLCVGIIDLNGNPRFAYRRVQFIDTQPPMPPVPPAPSAQAPRDLP